jgi:hypothetical protein
VVLTHDTSTRSCCIFVVSCPPSDTVPALWLLLLLSWLLLLLLLLLCVYVHDIAVSVL